MLLLTSALLILDLIQSEAYFAILCTSLIYSFPIGTLAQSTTSLFIPSFGDVNLQGAEVGVGIDGTTFVLSGSFTTDSFVSPFTSEL